MRETVWIYIWAVALTACQKPVGCMPAMRERGRGRDVWGDSVGRFWMSLTCDIVAPLRDSPQKKAKEEEE
eukprot:514015-Prorocentrum_lima.AAC.1